MENRGERWTMDGKIAYGKRRNGKRRNGKRRNDREEY
jgi:hypothetical protein